MIAVLFLVGLIFGSFVNALVWRLRQQELAEKKTKSSIPHSPFSILSGRSMCPNCHHQLAAEDLIPVLSWVTLKGRCRYCKKPISRQYPAVELAMAVVSVSSYIFWPGNLDSNGDWILFLTWLITSVGLLALLVYDFKWMLLPSKIIYLTLAVAVAGRGAYIISFETNKGHALIQWLLSVVVASGIFWLLFTISSGKWIGYGDVRLGLITGTVLADPLKSILMIFAASLIGTLFMLPALASGKKGLASKLPYGPFLITATWFSLIFGERIINGYKHLFLP